MGLVVEHNLKPRRNTIQCNECIHFHLNTGKCDAFPTGIPKEVILGMHDHRFPFKGDNGILFESMIHPKSSPKQNNAVIADQ